MKCHLTCTADKTETIWAGGYAISIWECNACGRTFESVFGSYEFCPHCRAKIVKEIVNGKEERNARWL